MKFGEIKSEWWHSLGGLLFSCKNIKIDEIQYVVIQTWMTEIIQSKRNFLSSEQEKIKSEEKNTKPKIQKTFVLKPFFVIEMRAVAFQNDFFCQFFLICF